MGGLRAPLQLTASSVRAGPRFNTSSYHARHSSQPLPCNPSIPSFAMMGTMMGAANCNKGYSATSIEIGCSSLGFPRRKLGTQRVQLLPDMIEGIGTQ
jgi:hypothetical protein